MKKRKKPVSTRKAPARKTAARKPARRHERSAAVASGTRPAGPLSLAAECTVADAEDLKARLVPLLEQNEVVTLEASAVRRIDTASLQVLVAFIHEREAAGRDTAWQAPAPALTEAARLLGLASILHLPSEGAQ